MSKKKGKNKNYSHNSKILAEAIASTTITHRAREKNGVRYYEGAFFAPDGRPCMGTEIERANVIISRITTELSGAYPYIFNFVNYICTHGKELVKLGDSESYYYMVTVPWEAFLNITLGDFTDQRQFLITELGQLMAKQQLKVIPYDDDTSIYSHPVRIALRTKSKKDMIAAEINRYKNLNVDPIGEIQIEFMKPLFKDVIDGTRYVNEPKAFHALLVKTAREVIGALNSPLFAQAMAEKYMTQQITQVIGDTHKNIHVNISPELAQAMIDNNPTKKEADAQHIIAYARFWNYLTLHDNGRGDYITVSLPDMFSRIGAQYVQEKNGILYIRDRNAASRFLQVAVGIFSQLQTPETNFLIENVERTEDENEIRVIIKRQYPHNKIAPS